MNGRTAYLDTFRQGEHLHSHTSPVAKSIALNQLVNNTLTKIAIHNKNDFNLHFASLLTSSLIQIEIKIPERVKCTRSGLKKLSSKIQVTNLMKIMQYLYPKYARRLW